MSPPQVAMSLFILTLWDYTPGHRGLQITWGNRIHRTKAVQISVGQGHLREKMPPEKGWERRAGGWISKGALEKMVAQGASAFMEEDSVEQALQVAAEGDTRTEGKRAHKGGT